MTTSTTTPGIVRELVDPDELICPSCREDAVELPAAEVDGRPGFVHRDGSALCGTRAGRVVEPIEVSR